MTRASVTPSLNYDGQSTNKYCFSQPAHLIAWFTSFIHKGMDVPVLIKKENKTKQTKLTS